MMWCTAQPGVITSVINISRVWLKIDIVGCHNPSSFVSFFCFIRTFGNEKAALIDVRGEQLIDDACAGPRVEAVGGEDEMLRSIAMSFVHNSEQSPAYLVASWYPYCVLTLAVAVGSVARGFG